MPKVFFIIFGGAIGATLRAFISAMFTKSYLGTFAVNLIGCFLIGICFAIAESSNWPQQIKLFVFTGFLGAFTTFSTFSLDALLLISTAQIEKALLYVFASNVFGIALAAIGLFTTRYILNCFAS